MNQQQQQQQQLAGNPPTFGAPSSTLAGGLATTPSGAIYSPAGTGAPATAVIFANAPTAPAPAPTRGSTTNPYIAQLGTTYAPAGAGAPKTAVSFAKAPIAPVLAPTGGFATTNPYIAPPGAAYAPAGCPVPVWQPPRRAAGVYLSTPTVPFFLYPCRRLYPHSRTKHATASTASRACGSASNPQS